MIMLPLFILLEKNGLTITNINNGKNYLEDYSFSNKTIEKVFIDEDIEVAEILKNESRGIFS